MCKDENNNVGYGCIVFIALAITFFLAGFSLKSFVSGPTAMDVYRGNTELVYKVVAGERVDSTVVYKSK